MLPSAKFLVLEEKILHALNFLEELLYKYQIEYCNFFSLSPICKSVILVKTMIMEMILEAYNEHVIQKKLSSVTRSLYITVNPIVFSPIFSSLLVLPLFFKSPQGQLTFNSCHL